MKILSILLILFSISQAELYHFSLDSVSREEAVDFETGSRFRLGWFSWDMVSPANRSKDGVVADYLLNLVGLTICGCDANSHVVFDSAYATTQTISQLKSAAMLSLHDTTVFKPLIRSPDSSFILDVPFPAYAMGNTRFVIKDEKNNYSLVLIQVFSKDSVQSCGRFYRCEHLVDIEWWYQTDGTPSFDEDVYIRRSSQIIRPAKQNPDKYAIYDIRGRRLPVSISGSGVRIRAEGGRFLRRIQLLQ